MKAILILIAFVFYIGLFEMMLSGCGCATEKSYTTIIRMNPDGTSEQWETCNTISWDGGFITFKPMSLDHEIRITGSLTVFKTKVVANSEIKQEKEKTTG